MSKAATGSERAVNQFLSIAQLLDELHLARLYSF